MKDNISITTITNSFLTSKTYLISSLKYKWCYLIDCGDYDQINKWLKLNSKIILGVFLTHTHFDHIYGINNLLNEYPECIIYTSVKGREGLYSEKLNLSKYHDLDFIFKGNEKLVRILSKGETVELFPNIILEVFETPGHDWSCLTYLIKNFIFTGDSYIPDFKTVTSFPKSDKEQAAESLSLLHDLVSEKITIYPGH